MSTKNNRKDLKNNRINPSIVLLGKQTGGAGVTLECLESTIDARRREEIQSTLFIFTSPLSF